jgi:alanyl-tRNA synthetase
MTANEIRRRYIDFFVRKHGHAEIKSSSLIPENDPTVLFTTAGMHPLVPFLMGEPHPSGTRLVDVQKCLRTDDIDEVGDKTHLTFFEMLGNWSLGDYFKEGAIIMSYEFMTTPEIEGGLGLDPDRIVVTCFAGDNDAPRDDEAASIWESLGFTRAENAKPGQKRLIYFYGKKENWWGPAGQTGPCGPDTEMFYDTRGGEIGKDEHPNDDSGRFVEIWNDVFMQYFKKEDGTFEPLKQQNVDTGMGFERVVGIIEGKDSPFETDLFKPIMDKIEELSSGNNDGDVVSSKRIIADHLRAATFILGDPWGVSPSNTDQGYILRRLIRRAIRHGKKIGIENIFTHIIAQIVIDLYGETYPELKQNQEKIIRELKIEEDKFQKTIEKGLKEMNKIWSAQGASSAVSVTEGDKAFYIYETYGFPYEMIVEELKKNGYSINEKLFSEKFKEAELKHQELSRAGSEQKFAGGLADHSAQTTKLHTATHLLHQALKNVLGPDVNQKGSNITVERLRFDFNYAEKMTPEQIKKVEEIVNEQIARKLPVSFEMMSVDEAKKQGAVGLFESKYGDKVKVYTVGDFSKEICGGPHVENTADLVSFKILKEESSSAGVRRIKAIVG